MPAIDLVTNNAQALALVGTVLTEAIALYIGYGALTSLVSPPLMVFLKGE